MVVQYVIERAIPHAYPLRQQYVLFETEFFELVFDDASRQIVSSLRDIDHVAPRENDFYLKKIINVLQGLLPVFTTVYLVEIKRIEPVIFPQLVNQMEKVCLFHFQTVTGNVYG